MTLAELLSAARQLPAADKLKLIRILAEDLDSAEDISPLVPDKVYHLLTPYPGNWSRPGVGGCSGPL